MTAAIRILYSRKLSQSNCASWQERKSVLSMPQSTLHGRHMVIPTFYNCFTLTKRINSANCFTHSMSYIRIPWKSSAKPGIVSLTHPLLSEQRSPPETAEYAALFALPPLAATSPPFTRQKLPRFASKGSCERWHRATQIGVIAILSRSS